ncbi:unnamed protein product [Trypanosoma congolense IL3000]|uniref:WGS project CAEQ00000000 data, annotated contig 1848 n=1 Tax=Trypanosoma congolense (strain IL3000) TaxID=1068625 RepID=F9W9C4_TRYCI|nr:unnamed protein product [Trypanosoma congolense IL3000]
MRLRAYILATILYLDACNARTLQYWPVKQAYELFDDVPRRILEKAAQDTRQRPVSPFPTLINSTSDPDDLESSSDSPTPEGSVSPGDPRSTRTGLCSAGSKTFSRMDVRSWSTCRSPITSKNVASVSMKRACPQPIFPSSFKAQPSTSPVREGGSVS